MGETRRKWTYGKLSDQEVANHMTLAEEFESSHSDQDAEKSARARKNLKTVAVALIAIFAVLRLLMKYL